MFQDADTEENTACESNLIHCHIKFYQFLIIAQIKMFMASF